MPVGSRLKDLVGQGARPRKVRSLAGVALGGLWLVLTALPAGAQDILIPPEPSVRPLISATYPTDADGNGIDDALYERTQTAESSLWAFLATETGIPLEAEELVQVELIFDRQITREQVAAFQALGGEIDYVYKAVSYGWNGRIPLANVTAVSSLMSLPPLLIQEAKSAELHMDTATRTGRIRPVWTTGFAGNAAGFDGDANTTIGVVDSGVDLSHTDLTGRCAYWHDYTTDGAASPVDIIQHGSHVTGMALGTGTASGSAVGTISYTQVGTLSGVSSGSFYPYPIELPAVSLTYTATARWNGGGSTTLYLFYKTKGASGGWTAPASSTGTSPLTLNFPLTGDTTRVYSAALLSNGAMTDFVVTSQVTNYSAVGDGFNKFSGVAPGCRWAGAKVFTNTGSGTSTTVSAGIDDLVANRVAYNIKVMNLSLGSIGDPGIDTTERQKINTAVNNGIVVVVSAGNDGRGTTVAKRTIDDPGRAAMALTVAASNDVNRLTDYTSQGFTTPGSVLGAEEDYKPDVMAPGGSQNYQSSILSVDSNSGDRSAFTDQQANDYLNIQGTSMASPFVAGCAALVIDALQQQGVTWDFASSQHARYVKMLLCATTSESNANREDEGVSRGDGITVNPTLQRASAGPDSFPVGKDKYEGYGMINPDAAVEAVSQTYTYGATATATLGSAVTDRRVWARTVSLTGGQAFHPTLTVPAGGDFDLYLYNAAPSAYGTPILLASSTATSSGTGETFSYTPVSATTGVLVVKRVSGSGTFSLVSDNLAYTVTFDAQGGTTATPTSMSVTYGAAYGTLATTTRTGYTFGGWWTGTGGTGTEVTATTTVTITAAQTLYAKWTANSYPVTFDAQSGMTASPTSKSVTYGAAYGTLATTTRTGYTFGGWWTGTGGTGTEVTAATTVTITAAQTLYAKWTANSYTVTFDAQSGTTATPTSMSVTYGAAYGTLATTTRTGYTLSGWWTGTGGTGTEVTAATTVAITAAQTLYAKWTANSYLVTFDAQGGTTASPATMSVTYGAAYGALATTTRTGYTLGGWWTGTGGTGTEVTAATTVTITAAQTLYAKWTATSSQKAILTFSILGFDGVIDEPAKTVVVALPFGTIVTSLTPTVGVSPQATVSPLSGVAQDFTNPVVYTVTAEDASTQAYTVTVTVEGDFTGDGMVDAVDLTEINEAVYAGSTDLKYDLNGDHVVDAADFEYMLHDLLGSTKGDADLNGAVDIDDYYIFIDGWYFGGNSWDTGDFDGSGSVDIDDYYLFIDGWYGL